MKVDIISGFLGAGKTTLIQKLIKEELFKEKIAILENEYGEVGIDGNLLKRENIDVKEITSGCICCSIVGNFKEALEEITRRYSPDRVIIEPSGIAKLSQVIQSINSVKDIKNLKINMQIVVVDIRNLDSYMNNFGEFYVNQIINAKTIILSRTQLADEKLLTYAVMAIRKLNPRCSIITTPWDKLSGRRILEVAEFKIEDIMSQINLVKKPLNTAHVVRGRSSNNSAKDVFDTWGQETPKAFSKEKLKNILNMLKDQERFGLILRAKGILETSNGKWNQFDYVPGEIEIKDINPDYIGRICVIGTMLKKDKLRELFLK